MPAQIAITYPQLESILDEAEGNGIVICESYMQGVLDIWVIDEESRNSDTHKSVIIDTEGNVLNNSRQHDND